MRRFTAADFCLLMLVALLGIGAIWLTHPGSGAFAVKAVSAAAQNGSISCPSYNSLSSAVPADMSSPNSQINANCFAWQEFIALNWTGDVSTCAADSNAQASSFGTPLDTSPKVWELYKQDTDIFLQGAAKPTAWCSASQAVPAKFRSLTTARLLSGAGAGGSPPKLLSATSKDADDTQVKLTQCAQAGGGACGQSGWLTAQSGLMALYEIRVNQDEFSYIDTNGLYNAVTQQTFVQSPGLNLPDGSSGGIGSIELKASWIELDDSSKWPYYKTSKALVVYPGSAQAKLVTVGLTGLHIIHKTAHSPQFIWATFEHVNNAPSTSDISSGTLLPWYTFYNPNCNPATDHYKCVANAQINSATPQTPYFPKHPADPYDAPVQVVRENPLSTTTTDNIVGINAWAQALIAQANPKSVFKNYQLVDVLWAQNPTPILAKATTPLTPGNPTPNQQIVADTTLETYMQNTNNCLGCHVYAPIASTASLQATAGATPVHALLKRPRLLTAQGQPPQASTPLLTQNPMYASDYSFLFNSAQAPSSQALHTVRLLRTPRMAQRVPSTLNPPR